MRKKLKLFLTAALILLNNSAQASTVDDVVMDLSNRNLSSVSSKEIPEGITRLNLSNNLLSSVDLSVFTRLEEIDLSGNCMDTSPVVSGLKNLRSLDLSNNPHLYSLPDVRGLPFLRTIVVDLQAVTEDFLSSVRALDEEKLPGNFANHKKPKVKVMVWVVDPDENKRFFHFYNVYETM